MVQSQYTTRILTPDNAEGWLTQSTNVEILNRVFSQKLFLAATDSPDNWREISAAEYEAYQAELKQAEEKQLAEAQANNEQQ